MTREKAGFGGVTAGRGRRDDQGVFFDPMIHSIHIIGSRQLGGAEQFYMRLVRALNRRGLSVLAVNRPGSAVNAALDHAVPQQTVAMRNGWDFFSALKIRRLIRSAGPSIVQTYMGRATRLTRLPRGAAAIHVARLGGYYKIKGYYQHARAWVGNTQDICDYLIREGLPADRVYHIGNFVTLAPPPAAVAVQALRQSLQIPAEAVVLLALGRFIEKKGFADLLSAFARVPRAIHGRPLMLVVAGDGPLQKPLHRQAGQLSLTSRMRWVGWQNDPGPFYDLADVLVCPSRQEPLGNVILEAWAHRLPVIATRTAGPLELVTAEENGLLVAIGDPLALAASITALIKAGPETWWNLAENGRRSVARHHSEEAVVQAYLALYADLQPGLTAGTGR
ncbi:MAG: glycosyltransferase [Desulfobacterales bacterium]